MTNERTPRPAAKPAALGALVGAACAALCLPFVAGWEGRRTTAYQDIVGVWTICDGDTKGVKPGQVETHEGCDVRLDTRLAEHARPVLACTPSLRGRDPQLAAAVSLAYNIGTAAYCRSTVDRRFDAGQWRSACDAFLMWNKAGGRIVRGLENRRRAERALCLRDLPK